ncbi:hypothetical protein LTR50_003621 [Elasticomyces elasticus]|nr:hypothetical protein LTR50_003621 [Elasticomyces elasticus]
MSGFGGFGGFGSSNNPQQPQQQPQQNPGFGFGQNNSNTGGFGSSGTAGFGSNNTAPASVFGTPNTTGAFGSGGFGSNNAQNTSPFGAKPAGFGSTTTTSGSGLFGSGTATTSNNAFGGFGGSNTGNATGFGSANTGGLFGSPAKPAFGSAATTTGGGLFGSGGSTTTGGFGSSTTGGFGSPGTGAFGASTGTLPQNTGTQNTPFNAFTERDPATAANSSYQCITFQQPYRDYSLEELRVADYAQGRRYGNSSGQANAFGSTTGFGGSGTTNTGGFGNTVPNTTGGLFGSQQGNNSSPFGTAQTTTNTGFGGSSMFGSQQKPATGGLFGSNTTPAQPASGGLFGTSNSNTGGFGSGGFGSATPSNVGGGLFGNQNTQNQNKPFGGFGSSPTTNTASPFGQSQPASTGGGLFGSNNTATTGGFGSNNQQQANNSPFAGFGSNQNQNQPQPQQQTGTSSLFGGVFGQNNTNQPKPNLFGGATTSNASPFGAAQGQQQPTTSLFGNNPNQQTPTNSLFGNNNNNNQAKPGLFGSLGTNNATNNTSSLFGNINNNNSQQQQQGQTSGLFGSTANNNQPKPGLFGNLGQTNIATNNTSGLFGGGNQSQGNSPFGISNNQQQPSANTNSLFGSSQQNQQPSQAPYLTTSVYAGSPYGNEQLFASLASSPPVGPLSTPLTGSQQRQRKPAITPIAKMGPAATMRLVTPQKQGNGYGFSYSTYGTPGSSQSSLGSSTLGRSLLQSGGLAKTLSTSHSASNLRNSFSAEDSVLRPGAFTPGSMRSYNTTSSLRTLKIDRTLRIDLFGSDRTNDPPSLSKRVSFDANTANGSSGKDQTNGGNTIKALVRVGENDNNDRALSATEMTSQRSTRASSDQHQTSENSSRPEMEQVTSHDLAIVPEEDSAPAQTQSNTQATSKSQNDPTPGEYWMKPTIKELRNLSRDQLKHVSGFTVGRVGVGKVEFDPVDLTTVPIDEIIGGIVNLTLRSATVYKSGVTTPPMGKGLNVPSTITLENSWPRAQGGSLPVREKKGPRFAKHIERLKRIEGTESVDFNADTGAWVFRVQHFTTYGLDDDGDDDEDAEDESMMDHSMMDAGESSGLSAAPDNTTPNGGSAQSPAQRDDSALMSPEDSNPDDTFEFKKGLGGSRKIVPGGFTGEEVYEDESMGGEEPETEFSHENVAQEALEDPFSHSQTGNETLEDLDMAGSFPKRSDTYPAFRESAMPKSILKNGQFGTPAKALNVDVGGDWAEQLQRTVSPKKQDRQALRERQASAMQNLEPTKTATAPKASFAASKGFQSTMDIMNSLWAPSQTKGGQGIARNTGIGGKGFEWPYAKQSKTGDDTDDMNENDKAFHDSVKPSWTRDQTLVYAMPGDAPLMQDGILVNRGGSIVSEGKDIRFAKFSEPVDLNPSNLTLQKTNSPITLQDGAPYAQPLDRLRFEALAHGAVGEYEPISHTECSVWQVASILFDPLEVSCSKFLAGIPESQIPQFESRIRRDALSAFWSVLVAPACNMLASRNGASAEERALAFLVANRVDQAVGALLEGKDYHLTTLVAQVPGSEKMRQEMRAQIESWRNMNVLSEIVEPIRALYEIVGGNCGECQGKKGLGVGAEDMATTFKIAERWGMDWRQAFGLRLWYGNLPGDSIQKAVKDYSKDLATGTETVRPVPWFTEQGKRQEWNDAKMQEREDIVFGILRLYTAHVTGEELDVEMTLTPATVSGNPLNARLAWQIASVFKAKGLPSLNDEQMDRLTVSFAAQLESHKAITTAAFVLAHLSNAESRSIAIQQLLLRNPDLKDAEVDTLTKASPIPEQWIWKSKAILARNVAKDAAREAEYWLRAGEAVEAHNVLCHTVGPRAIIEQDYDQLRELLGQFMESRQELERQVETWNVGAQVYFDFVHLLDLQRAGSEEEMGRVVARLANTLPGMIGNRKVGLEERVAVCEMARMVADAAESLGKGYMDLGHADFARLPVAGDQRLRQNMDMSAAYRQAVLAGGR